jgi:hypothetical protein
MSVSEEDFDFLLFLLNLDEKLGSLYELPFKEFTLSVSSDENCGL